MVDQPPHQACVLLVLSGELDRGRFRGWTTVKLQFNQVEATVGPNFDPKPNESRIRSTREELVLCGILTISQIIWRERDFNIIVALSTSSKGSQV